MKTGHEGIHGTTFFSHFLLIGLVFVAFGEKLQLTMDLRPPKTVAIDLYQTDSLLFCLEMISFIW